MSTAPRPPAHLPPPLNLTSLLSDLSSPSFASLSSPSPAHSLLPQTPNPATPPSTNEQAREIASSFLRTSEVLLAKKGDVEVVEATGKRIDTIGKEWEEISKGLRS